MNRDPGKITLIIATVCIILISLANLLEYISTGDSGGLISNICFIAADICVIIGWISYFRKKKC